MSTHEDVPGEPRARRVPWGRWEWWHQRTTTTRRAIRTSLALVLTLVAALAFGVLTARADSSLGPHRAQYSVTPQHEIVMDLGPLGSVLLDSPLPWPLGVAVVVEEIPLELTAVPASPVTGLAGDVAAYAQVAAQPRAAIAEAATLLVRDAVGRAVIAWSLMLVVIAVGRLASRGLLRREVASAVRRPGVAPLAAIVTVSLAALPVAAAVNDRPPSGTTIGALAGTPLEDLRMTGRMAQLIDTYGGYLVDAYDENEAFYGEVSANLEAAYADNRAPLRPPSIPILAPTPVDDAATPSPEGDDGVIGTDDDGAPADGDDAAVDGDDAADDAADGDDAAAGADGGAPNDDAAADDPAQGAELPDLAGAEAPEVPETRPAEAPPRREPVTLLLVSDLHCNVGMAPVIADAARLSGASVVLDGGDTVMSGTSVESYCVNAFAGALPEDLPVVVSTGNHDSVTTANQMNEAGYTVLGGDPVEIAGVRILGDTDPTLTAVGEGTRPERDESIAELGSRMADVSCEAADNDDPVDILLIHNPRAAEETMARGCAPLALSGHWHRRVGPEVVDLGVRYVSSSTAGASGGLTVGPLNGSAEMTVLRYDIGRGAPMDYRVITVGTDASVDLGRWYRFPTPQPEPDPMVDGPLPEPGPTVDAPLPTPDDASGPAPSGAGPTSHTGSRHAAAMRGGGPATRLTTPMEPM